LYHVHVSIFIFPFQVAVDKFSALTLFDGHQEQLPACKKRPL